MPTHTFKPELSVLRNSAVIVDTEVQWTSRGRKQRRNIRASSLSSSPQKSPSKSPSKKARLEDMAYAEDSGYDLSLEPLKLTQTKTQNDYLRDWAEQKADNYLQHIMAGEGTPEPRSCVACDGDGSWKCKDCVGKPVLCLRCCREKHDRDPFHRVQHWNGKFYEDAWLYQAGVVLHFGHGGRPCPNQQLGVTPAEQCGNNINPAPAREEETWWMDDNELTQDHGLEFLDLPAPFDPDAPVLTEPEPESYTGDPSEACWQKRHDIAGNPFLIIVHTNGMHLLPVRWCQCLENGHEWQVLDMGFYPTSTVTIRTVFTFQCLDNFLAENQECKTSTYQYVEKLRRLTNSTFPHTVPNRYQELIRVERQWRYLKNMMWHGFAHEGRSPGPGELTVTCPTCPQPGINLPDDWENNSNSWLYTRMFVIDGNFTAVHLRQKHPENDVTLSDGTGFMTCRQPYLEHLKIARDRKQRSDCNEHKAHNNDRTSRQGVDCTGIGSVGCARAGFFIPGATVDFQKGEQQKNIDYAVCQALNNSTMKRVKRALLIYDIMCQWHKNLPDRVAESGYLEISDGLHILKAIGDWHVNGHVLPCEYRFGLAFIDGIGIIDGEVMETLWSVLNEISRTTRGATLAHRAEILDDHMNHSNWKKLVGVAGTLVKKWKRALLLYHNSEEAFSGLSSTADPGLVQKWKNGAEKAKRNREKDVKAMDYFMVKGFPAPGRAEMQLALTKKEAESNTVGLAAFLVQGLKIQETQISLQQFVRQAGNTPTVDDEIAIAQRRVKLSSRITSHQHQARQLLHLTDDEEDDQTFSYHDSEIFVDDGYGNVILVPRNNSNYPIRPQDPADKPEYFRLGMPSNLGMERCQDRRLQAACEAEVSLREGQMNDALQSIRLIIGKKAFVFRTGVRSAPNKTIKTRSYSLIQSIDTTLRYHAQLYRRARSAVQTLSGSEELLTKYKVLEPEDLKTTTTRLGQPHQGTKHKHLAWFWYMDVAGDSIDDDVMTECKVNWLRARENFQRAEEEVMLVWHEMDWTIRYFRYQAKRWSSRQVDCQTLGHASYACRMETMWERFAARAEEAFALAKTRFPSPLSP